MRILIYIIIILLSLSFVVKADDLTTDQIVGISVGVILGAPILFVIACIALMFIAMALIVGVLIIGLIASIILAVPIGIVILVVVLIKYYVNRKQKKNDPTFVYQNK